MAACSICRVKCQDYENCRWRTLLTTVKDGASTHVQSNLNTMQQVLCTSLLSEVNVIYPSGLARAVFPGFFIAATTSACRNIQYSIEWTKPYKRGQKRHDSNSSPPRMIDDPCNDDCHADNNSDYFIDLSYIFLHWFSVFKVV